MSVESHPPKIEISDAHPLNTAEYRQGIVFSLADPEGILPDISLASGTPNPHDRPRPSAARVGIFDANSTEIGAFNLVQTAGRSWINNVHIDPEFRGKRRAVAAYVGVITVLHEAGRTLESDPQGLSEDSLRVWDSLVKRGVAEQLGTHDIHGRPRFVSTSPNRPNDSE